MTEGATPRWIEYLPVSSLVLDERNAKAHDVEELRRSLGRFGYTEPVMIDERTGRLVAGHGRTTLLLDDLAAGREPPDGVTVAEDGVWRVPVVRGWASENDNEAEAYLVASNQLVIAGGWIDRALVEALDRAAATPLGLAGIGFDTDELTRLREQLDASSRHVEFDASTDPPDERWLVLVECSSEQQQRALIDRFMTEGLSVKALTS